MKTILSGLLALAFMLSTAPSHALNPKALIADFQVTGQTVEYRESPPTIRKPKPYCADNCQRNYKETLTTIEASTRRCETRAIKWVNRNGKRVKAGYDWDYIKKVCYKNRDNGKATAKAKSNTCMKNC